MLHYSRYRTEDSTATNITLIFIRSFYFVHVFLREQQESERKVANNMNNLSNDYNHPNIPHFVELGKYQSARCGWDVHEDFTPKKGEHKSVLQNQLLLLLKHLKAFASITGLRVCRDVDRYTRERINFVRLLNKKDFKAFSIVDCRRREVVTRWWKFFLLLFFQPVNSNEISTKSKRRLRKPKANNWQWPFMEIVLIFWRLLCDLLGFFAR